MTAFNIWCLDPNGRTGFFIVQGYDDEEKAKRHARYRNEHDGRPHVVIKSGQYPWQHKDG